MSNERTEKTLVAIVSLSIDRDLLNRLDDQAEIENRNRSNMIARMIEFYIDCLHYDALDANVAKARLNSIYGKEINPEA